VTVENTGDATGAITLTLYIDDEAVDNGTFTLDPNTSREAELRTNFSETGRYNVSVNSLSSVRILVVEETCEYCRESQDLDGDGLYEDIDGDGDLDFNDVMELAFALPVPADQVPRVDFDGDGDADFDDVIELTFTF
jgi:PKD repeat protein